MGRISVERIPLKRPGAPHDLDAAVVFLAAESSRYITGQTLLVDGGISTGALRALPKSLSIFTLLMNSRRPSPAARQRKR